MAKRLSSLHTPFFRSSCEDGGAWSTSRLGYLFAAGAPSSPPCPPQHGGRGAQLQEDTRAVRLVRTKQGRVQLTLSERTSR